MGKKSRKLEKVCAEHKYTIQFISSIATIIVSLVTLVITIRMTMLQQEIDKQDKIPQINVYGVVEREKKEDFYGEDCINIENKGGNIINPEAYAISFYKIYYTKNESDDFNYEMIPLTGYYYSSKAPENSENIILKLKGYKNIERSEKFIDNALENKPSQINSLKIYVDSYVKLEYEDCFNEKHEEYYRVYFGQSKKLDNNTGKEIFDDYYKKCNSNNEVSIHEESSECLYKILDIQ